MGLRVSGPRALGHAGRAHPALLSNPGGHAHPSLAILSGPEKPELSKRRSPCWARCPSPLEEPPDAQAQRLGLFPRPDLVSTGLGDAGKARFQPWDRIQRTVTPNPQALAGNTPQHCPARAAQLRVWPGGQLSTLLSLRGRGGTRSRTPLLQEG